jgi:hypothetical protein
LNDLLRQVREQEEFRQNQQRTLQEGGNILQEQQNQLQQIVAERITSQAQTSPQAPPLIPLPSSVSPSLVQVPTIPQAPIQPPQQPITSPQGLLPQVQLQPPQQAPVIPPLVQQPSPLISPVQPRILPPSLATPFEEQVPPMIVPIPRLSQEEVNRRVLLARVTTQQYELARQALMQQVGLEESERFSANYQDINTYFQPAGFSEYATEDQYIAESLALFNNNITQWKQDVENMRQALQQQPENIVREILASPNLSQVSRSYFTGNITVDQYLDKLFKTYKRAQKAQIQRITATEDKINAARDALIQNMPQFIRDIEETLCDKNDANRYNTIRQLVQKFVNQWSFYVRAIFRPPRNTSNTDLVVGNLISTHLPNDIIYFHTEGYPALRGSVESGRTYSTLNDFNQQDIYSVYALLRDPSKRVEYGAYQNGQDNLFMVELFNYEKSKYIPQPFEVDIAYQVLRSQFFDSTNDEIPERSRADFIQNNKKQYLRGLFGVLANTQNIKVLKVENSTDYLGWYNNHLQQQVNNRVPLSCDINNVFGINRNNRVNNYMDGLDISYLNPNNHQNLIRYVAVTQHDNQRIVGFLSFSPYNRQLMTLPTKQDLNFSRHQLFDNPASDYLTLTQTNLFRAPTGVINKESVQALEKNVVNGRQVLNIENLYPASLQLVHFCFNNEALIRDPSDQSNIVAVNVIDRYLYKDENALEPEMNYVAMDNAGNIVHFKDADIIGFYSPSNIANALLLYYGLLDNWSEDVRANALYNGIHAPMLPRVVWKPNPQQKQPIFQTSTHDNAPHVYVTNNVGLLHGMFNFDRGVLDRIGQIGEILAPNLTEYFVPTLDMLLFTVDDPERTTRTRGNYKYDYIYNETLAPSAEDTLTRSRYTAMRQYLEQRQIEPANAYVNASEQNDIIKWTDVIRSMILYRPYPLFRDFAGIISNLYYWYTSKQGLTNQKMIPNNQFVEARNRSVTVPQLPIQPPTTSPTSPTMYSVLPLSPTTSPTSPFPQNLLDLLSAPYQ